MIPTLNALQLRALADAASSKRKPGGEPFYLVLQDGFPDPDLDPRPALKLVQGKGATEPVGAVLEIDTFEVERRPTVDHVVIGCEGDDQRVELANSYDAVFWSEAAVEKFVLPYYASKSLWEAAAVLDKISHYWYGRVPADTNELPLAPFVENAGEAMETEGWGEGDVAYALMHTPDSEWNTISESGAIGSDLHLFVRNPTTGSRVVRLSDLPDPPGGTRAGRAGPARRTPAATDGA
jgi:hypothetical protein